VGRSHVHARYAVSAIETSGFSNPLTRATEREREREREGGGRGRGGVAPYNDSFTRRRINAGPSSSRVELVSLINRPTYQSAHSPLSRCGKRPARYYLLIAIVSAY